MRPLFAFYILVFSIFIQLGWWGFLLVALNNEVDHLKTEILYYNHNDPAIIAAKQLELKDKLHKRWMMVMGEGTVFLLFMTSGILITRRAFRKEEEVNRQQKNFLLSITHELKSPIASIKLYMQTLQKHDIPIDKQQHFIRQAVTDADRLNLLVENILLASQLDGSNHSYHKSLINLSELFKDKLNSNLVHEERKIKLLYTLDEAIDVLADPVAMISLLNNLLENAVKYSPAQSSVKIELQKVRDKAVLRVIDEGAGIPEDKKRLVFQKFYRIGNEETRKTKGTGLGLYIVKHIVNGHLGTIQIIDNKPQGTIFEVRLPLA